VGEKYGYPNFPTEEAATGVVTASLLRELPAGRLIADAKRTEAYTARTWAASKERDPELRQAARVAGIEAATVRYWKSRRDKARRQLSAIEKSRGGRPRLYDADHFAEVAQVYLAGGDTPTIAVAAHFYLSRSAAAKQVARARKLGLLAETTKGKPSGLPPQRSSRRRQGRSNKRSRRKGNR
jgi:transposase